MEMPKQSFQQYLENTNALVNEDFVIHKRQKTSVHKVSVSQPPKTVRNGETTRCATFTYWKTIKIQIKWM